MSKVNELRISVAGGLLASVVLLAGLVPSTLSAQDMDARWLPWLGCWEAVDGGEEAPLLCVSPATQGAGVEFVTWAAGEQSATETLLADGLPRNAEREECMGTEEAGFSADGRRVYLKSDYVCQGGIERGASGILAMINPMEWVDIKAVEGSPWVLRYRLARASKVQEAGMGNVVASRASAVKAARIAASAPLTEEDLIDAAGKVDGVAMEALIVERGDAFSVNSGMLIRLADAGVPESVIDLVVALSYPDQFAVKSGPGQIQENRADPGYPRRYGMSMGVGFFDPWYWGYGASSWYSPYYYGGYGPGYGSGYGYGYGYGGYPYYRPSVIVVQPRGSYGQMIKGQGYTRGGSGSTGGQARPRGSAVGSGSGSRSPSSPGVSSGGSSSGRTAKPRGGGSGGATRAPSASSQSSGSQSSAATTVRTAKPRTGGGGGLR